MRTFVLIAFLAACSKENPYYCPGHPDDNCLLDADVNAPQGCTSSDQCTNPGKPICDTAQKVCVACTASDIGACAGTTPVCSEAKTCTACTMNSQCGSAVCLGDGACADAGQVAYVAATGDDTAACTASAPCKTIASAATKKQIVKVMTDLDEAVVLDGVTVTVVGDPGISVRRTTVGGPTFDLRGMSTITLRGLTIRDGLGTAGHGVAVNPGQPVNLTLDGVALIDNTGFGVTAQGGSITMSRCVVSGNRSGGVSVMNNFNITNSIIVSNGGATSLFGGVYLTPAGNVAFKFNTVANNTAMTSAVSGIQCTSAVTIASSIVSGNSTGGSCAFEYSLFDSNQNVTGSNRAGEAKFKSVNPATPRAVDYYRIQPASDAVDKADPASTMSTDIDGDDRPQGSAPDIGADEAAAP